MEAEERCQRFALAGFECLVSYPMIFLLCQEKAAGISEGQFQKKGSLKNTKSEDRTPRSRDNY